MPRDYSKSRGAGNGRYKTGLAAPAKRVSLYNTWQCMKQRCLNPNHPKYARYGGRGISIDPAWLDIEGFFAWAMHAGWKEGLTLDRVDNDGNYCPTNCRWVTASENSRKKSTTRLSEFDVKIIKVRLASGEAATRIADDFGVCHGTIWHIEKGITHKHVTTHPS